ncbi:hypothetical protein [[Actinomadura] parvosata]|uniref:hypothetical protein n=1 Tax=[Actinomadura] parvosata TaxID=1955412 RepID=UPI0016497891
MAGLAGRSMPSMVRKSRWKPSGRATSAFWYAWLSYAATGLFNAVELDQNDALRDSGLVGDDSTATGRDPDKTRPLPAWTAGPAGHIRLRMDNQIDRSRRRVLVMVG